jgi:phosphopantetheine--protein transferase-like protein
MIKGIGIDIIRIRRIDEALARWGKQFEERVFTDNLRKEFSQTKRYRAHIA